MKLHDENKDLALFSRIGRIDMGAKMLLASKSAIIGNRSWGRIDFLVNHCGWHFVWDNTASPMASKRETVQIDKESIRAAKKATKEHKLTDKTKKKK